MKKKQPLLAVLGLSVTLLSCASARVSPRERYQQVKLQPVDAIIVPGTPYKNYQLDSLLKGRILWAYILWKNGLTKNIIFSGAAVYTPFIEAKVMGRYAQELGVPAEHIFYDTLAQHSTENVYYSYLLARQLHFKSLALATDPFQAASLNKYLSQRFGTPIQPLPFITDSIAKYNYLQPTIMVKDLVVPHFKSIKQRENIFKRWGGTLGNDIPWHQYPSGKLPAL